MRLGWERKYGIKKGYLMIRTNLIAALSAVLLFVSFSTPASADIIYSLNFNNGGTGSLTLNFDSVEVVKNINYTSIAPYFVGVSAFNVDGHDFTITSANLKNGFIETGAAGQLYTLTVQEKQPIGVSDGTLFLDLYTGSWQLHSTPYDHTEFSGRLTIGSPVLAAVPEPSTWAMMLLGFAGIGFLACRRRYRIALEVA
jgi:hypothetical protein